MTFGPYQKENYEYSGEIVIGYVTLGGAIIDESQQDGIRDEPVSLSIGGSIIGNSRY